MNLVERAARSGLSSGTSPRVTRRRTVIDDPDEPDGTDDPDDTMGGPAIRISMATFFRLEIGTVMFRSE